MFHNNEGFHSDVHDPQFAEIDQILNEVALNTIQTVAYATEYLPYGAVSQTAQCIIRADITYHRLLININNKRFTIQTSNVYTLSSPARIFNICDPNFLSDLARYLKDKGVLSLPKYWFVKLRLWWNK